MPLHARIKHPWDKYYHRAHWKKCLRPTVLARDPICVICGRNASTDVDHIKPHKGNWTLFADLNNLQGLCAHCHSRKTMMEDGGGGQTHRLGAASGPRPLGDGGRVFQSSSISQNKLDAALDFDVEDLLKDLP